MSDMSEKKHATIMACYQQTALLHFRNCSLFGVQTFPKKTENLLHPPVSPTYHLNSWMGCKYELLVSFLGFGPIFQVRFNRNFSTLDLVSSAKAQSSSFGLALYDPSSET